MAGGGTRHSMASSAEVQRLRDLIEIHEASRDKLRREINILKENSVNKEEYDAVVKKLEKEEKEHAETKNTLAITSERLQFALGETDILSKQLEWEKQAFDKALSQIKSKLLKQSLQKDKLISKCTEIETHIQKQENILSCKENEIKALHYFVNEQKQILKKKASEFKIQMQQESYIENVLRKRLKKKNK
ncbi:spermatogenesis-associated protein 24 [Protobothrops mucrosquamatus]|uniref:spermatogenesis-associated protein 24 n=1 Tax=Protobothrops mucrosquamatus TaxID=103944 RepID=UPI000775DD6C|nr:spermatogenesis-associated protein 24 [Protobothrops mucrosquamatus]